MRRLPTEEPTVYVKADKRGTVVTDKGTFHFDPEGVPAARARRVPMSVFTKAKAKGLVSKSRAPSAGAGSSVPSGPSTENAALIRRQRNSDGEDAGIKSILGMTGAETRDTTAFPVEGGKNGGLSPDGSQVDELEDGDDAGDDEGQADDENDLHADGDDEGDDGDDAGSLRGDAPPNDGEGGDDDDAGDDAGDDDAAGGAGAGSGGEPEAGAEAAPTTRRAAAKRKGVGGGRRPNAD